VKFVRKAHRNVTKTLRQAARPVSGIWPRFSDALMGLLALGVVAFACVTYVTPVAKWTGELVTGNKYLALAEGLLNPFRNSHFLLDSGLPIYDLKIPRQEYARIENVVNQARKKGIMTEDLRVWVRGTFMHQGESYNVKVRIRGDLPNHWSHPKKSWAIKFGKRRIPCDGQIRKEPIYFQGKRRINLIIPIDREYALAPFVNALMRERGLVAPRDQFVV
jgi:hypothetical protein